MPSFFLFWFSFVQSYFSVSLKKTLYRKKSPRKKKTLSLWLFIAKEMTHIYCKHKYLLVIIGAKKEHPTFMDVVHTLVRLK